MVAAEEGVSRPPLTIVKRPDKVLDTMLTWVTSLRKWDNDTASCTELAFVTRATLIHRGEAGRPGKQDGRAP